MLPLAILGAVEANRLVKFWRLSEYVLDVDRAEVKEVILKPFVEVESEEMSDAGELVAKDVARVAIPGLAELENISFTMLDGTRDGLLYMLEDCLEPG